MRTPFLVIASHRRWRGNPVNYARAYARLYYDWIATVAMLPRDDKMLKSQNKKNKAPYPVPLRWRGAAQRRGGQRMQECVAFLCHPVPLILPCHPSARCPQDPGNYAHTHSLVIASAAKQSSK